MQYKHDTSVQTNVPGGVWRQGCLTRSGQRLRWVCLARVSPWEPQVEGEVGEDVVNPGGDCVETAEGKRDEVADTAPVPVAGQPMCFFLCL